MTFDQLDYFIAAVKETTFFDAAESLHMTQSALSKQIMKLEWELDLTLFDRSGRSARLTEAGQLFLRRLRLSPPNTGRPCFTCSNTGIRPASSCALAHCPSCHNMA
ncbi:MAG: LysR family transcriptional regulator [Lachnospiraceae bacterium]|nr:LysR family transcriptional regulator [Lachnospiraceae bacterium]